MGTTIRLSDEAKDRLDVLKREDETYDDLIIRLSTRDLFDAAGSLDVDPDALRAATDRVARDLDEDLQTEASKAAEDLEDAAR